MRLREKVFVHTLFALLCCFGYASAATIAISQLKQLYQDLLTNYDTRIRPRLDQGTTVYTNSSFVPNNIIEFDTSEQKFSILGYVELEWDDELLIWDPASYSGISQIKIPVKEIWTPSLILMKAFDGSGIIGLQDTDIARVTSDGHVKWTPEGIFSVVCEVDIQFYPFDEQMCAITYYVSDEVRTAVHLTHTNEVARNEYIENSEWELVKISRGARLMYNAYFIDIKFLVQRRASFTTFTIITPLLMLAFLNVCVFLVPIDSGEKGSFSITIFLSYGIFVTIVSDTLPHNSLQVSYFVLFIIVLLLLSVLSVFYTIVQAKLVAAFGDQECKLRKYICCLKKKSKDDEKTKVTSLTNDDVVVESLDDEKKGSIPDQVLFVVPEKMKGGMNGGMSGAINNGMNGGNNIGMKEKGSVNNDGIDSGEDEEEDDEDKFTWLMFFEKLDTFFFVLFFALIMLCTLVFFALMMQRLNKDTLEKFGM